MFGCAIAGAATILQSECLRASFNRRKMTLGPTRPRAGPEIIGRARSWPSVLFAHLRAPVIWSGPARAPAGSAHLFWAPAEKCLLPLGWLLSPAGAGPKVESGARAQSRWHPDLVRARACVWCAHDPEIQPTGWPTGGASARHLFGARRLGSKSTV